MRTHEMVRAVGRLSFVVRVRGECNHIDSRETSTRQIELFAIASIAWKLRCESHPSRQGTSRVFHHSHANAAVDLLVQVHSTTVGTNGLCDCASIMMYDCADVRRRL